MKKIILATTLGAILSGCASLSSYQDAKALDKGEMQGFLTVGKYGQTYVDQDDEDVDAALDLAEDLDMVLIEVGARLGVMPNLDIGIK